MINLTFNSSNNTFTWTPEPDAVEYQVSISINGGGFSVLYQGTDTSCVINLSFSCQVEAKGKTKEKTGSSTTWGPETDCINNPISYNP